MNVSYRKQLRRMLVVLACILALGIMGCEGKDPRKAVTETLKEAVGDKAVQKSEEMREQLDETMKEKARDILKLDGQNKEDEAVREATGESTEGSGQ